MLPLRRAAKAFSSGVYVDLSLLIFEEKCVYEASCKLISAKASASANLVKWAKGEENYAILDVVSKIAELDWIWSKVQQDYAHQYLQYRKAFKDILTEDKDLEDFRKTRTTQLQKTNKIRKQIEAARRKSDLIRLETLEKDLTMALTHENKTESELQAKTIKHDIFKGRVIKDALIRLTEAGIAMAKKCLHIYEAQHRLASYIPTIPIHMCPESKYSGPREMDVLVSSVAERLGMPRPPRQGTVATNGVAHPLSSSSTPSPVSRKPFVSGPMVLPPCAKQGNLISLPRQDLLYSEPFDHLFETRQQEKRVDIGPPVPRRTPSTFSKWNDAASGRVANLEINHDYMVLVSDESNLETQNGQSDSADSADAASITGSQDSEFMFVSDVSSSSINGPQYQSDDKYDNNVCTTTTTTSYYYNFPPVTLPAAHTSPDLMEMSPQISRVSTGYPVAMSPDYPMSREPNFHLWESTQKTTKLRADYYRTPYGQASHSKLMKIITRPRSLSDPGIIRRKDIFKELEDEANRNKNSEEQQPDPNGNG